MPISVDLQFTITGRDDLGTMAVTCSTEETEAAAINVLRNLLITVGVDAGDINIVVV